ncbi:hypothetical protein QE410_001850 [Microbacterium sp. SORGH_AS 1204]|nr:hypothetical protein [Microbacterium sp. SORGH_AS_1204]
MTCASAAAWKVRADTPDTPSARRRPRISPAAFAVNVTAITRCGEYAPVSTPWAMRRVITRVLPVPAPASTHTGPRNARAASS